MTSATIYNPLEDQQAEEGEIASLALKFYLDSNCEDGHERENRLAAEYMLAQKHLIEYRIISLHNQGLARA